MVKKLGCSPAMLVHLNGLMDVPSLQPGDVFKYRPLNFHVVVNVPEKEVCLYDGENFVKAYSMVAMKDTGRKNFETTVKDEQASFSIYDKHYPQRTRPFCWPPEDMSSSRETELPVPPDFI